MVILPSIRRKYMSRRNPGGKIPLGDAVVTLDKDAWQYTGSAITPTPIVTLYGNLLTVNEDFTVGYTGNVNVGQGVVTVTGMGQYEGQRQKSFVIEAAPAPPGWDFDVTKTEFDKSIDKWPGASTDFSNRNGFDLIDDGMVNYGVYGVYSYDMDGNDIGNIDRSSARSNTSAFAQAMTPDGLKLLYCSSSGSGSLRYYPLAEAFDITSAGSAVGLGSLYSGNEHFCSAPTNEKWISSAGNTIIVRFFDGDRATINSQTSLNPGSGSDFRIDDAKMSPDGMTLVVLFSCDLGSQYNLLMKKYSLSSAFDVTTMTEVGTYLFDGIVSNRAYGGTLFDITKSCERLVLWVNLPNKSVLYQYNLRK